MSYENRNGRMLAMTLACAVCVATTAKAAPVIAPESGYSITWDGNDGDFFGAPVPTNLASSFGTQIQSSALAAGTHNVPGNVNDGVYGNASSWIGGDGDPMAWVGIDLGGEYDISSLAWGRDNTGAFIDRWAGVYTLQVTTSPTPSTTANWTTVGTLDYQAASGTFSAAQRHEYEVAAGGSPLIASGVRLLVPVTGLAGGTAIDEIELYGAATVQPVPQTGLRSWLKGDGDVILSGSSITQVSDHSFNGNHATIGISPTVGSINGLPAAHFDGAPANQHLNLPVTGPTGLDIANNDYEIFIIAKSTTANTNVEFLVGGPVPHYELHLNGSAGARFIPSDSSTPSPDTYGDLGVVGQFSDGRAHLFNMRVEDELGILRVVGMENGDTVADARSAVDGILTLGLRTNGSLAFAGDMGEVLIYNRALSEAERRQVERHLARKWNAPLNVASQTQGGIAFANEVINGGAISSHQIDHLNNALYGNPESWIGGNTGASTAFAGVGFDDRYDISALAFGRNSGPALSSPDRSAGTYTFEFTRDLFDPTADPSIIAALDWTQFHVEVIDTDTVAGVLRRYIEFDTIFGVTGVRVLLSSNSIAIDELEVYGLATIPEPTGGLMLLALLGGLGARRRRA